MRRILALFALAVTLLLVRPVRADDRSVLSDAIARVATAAEVFARSADASQDRAVRRKVAAKAREISEDLTSLSRRARKDVALRVIAKDAMALSRDTAQLIELADEAEDKAERKSLRAQATGIDQQLAAVRVQIDAAGTAEAKAPPAKPAPMSNEAFNTLLTAVKRENFDDKRLAVLNLAVPTNWFTTAQIGAMMDVFSRGGAKVDAAVAMWPHMLDPENSFTLYGKLTFQSDKDELKKRTTK